MHRLGRLLIACAIVAASVYAPAPRVAADGGPFGVASEANEVWRWLTAWMVAGGKVFHSENTIGAELTEAGYVFSASSGWTNEEETCVRNMSYTINWVASYKMSNSCDAILKAKFDSPVFGTWTDAGDAWTITSPAVGSGLRMPVAFAPMAPNVWEVLPQYKGSVSTPVQYQNLNNWRFYVDAASRGIPAQAYNSVYMNLRYLYATSAPWTENGVWNLEAAGAAPGQVVSVKKVVTFRSYNYNIYSWVNQETRSWVPYQLEYGPFQASPVEIQAPASYADIINITQVMIINKAVYWAVDPPPTPTPTRTPTVTPTVTPVPTSTPVPTNTPDPRLGPLLTAVARPTGTPWPFYVTPTPGADLPTLIYNLPEDLMGRSAGWMLSWFMPTRGLAERVGGVLTEASTAGRFPLGVGAQVGAGLEGIAGQGSCEGELTIAVPAYKSWPAVSIPLIGAVAGAWAAMALTVTRAVCAGFGLIYLVGRVRGFLGQGGGGGE